MMIYFGLLIKNIGDGICLISLFKEFNLVCEV